MFFYLKDCSTLTRLRVFHSMTSLRLHHPRSPCWAGGGGVWRQGYSEGKCGGAWPSVTHQPIDWEVICGTLQLWEGWRLTCRLTKLDVVSPTFRSTRGRKLMEQSTGMRSRNAEYAHFTPYFSYTCIVCGTLLSSKRSSLSKHFPCSRYITFSKLFIEGQLSKT